MIVAMIDDGVSKKTVDNLEFSLQIDKNGMITQYTGHTDSLSHGSICAAIIRKYNPHAQLGSIKILDAETRRGHCEDLRKAIYWCMDNDVKIINLSLGSVSVNDYQPLLKAVNAAYLKGIVIISACKNGSDTSYPAAFSNVIGVQCDYSLQGDAYYARKPNNNGIDFSASALHELKELSACPLNGWTPRCNSYAAPVITSKVYTILTKRPQLSFDNIKGELNILSTMYVSAYQPTIYKRTDWVDHVDLLVFGNSPLTTTNMRHWNVNRMIYCDSNSTQPDQGKISKDTTIAIYHNDSKNFKHFDFLEDHQLLFLNRIRDEELTKYRYRVFIPTLINDYSTEQNIDNERPVVAIIQNTVTSDYPIYTILKDMFIQKGFQPLLLSEYAIDILIGAVFIDHVHFYNHNCIYMADQLRCDLLITHTNLESLSILNPDIVLCDADIRKLVHDKVSMNTPVIEMTNRNPSKIFLELCEFICE
ncbi:S8 family serine peptidase [Paenibacillus albidus]|uniref:S8 family serine peptidase n=1 Tax=Paenibacillus albidus TaxID=2041023 RepID=UPI001BE9CE13|nr:S8 family serine peptidase [Paenibacillus albidus]MBT2290003.1 S8 family serine peptidase [Paenibacillus albidus]